MLCPVQAIFVPQGAEFKAVQQGIKRSGAADNVLLYATPMGPKPTQHYLEQWIQTERQHLGHAPSVLLVGLCGSLTTRLGVGRSRPLPKLH